MNGCVICGKPVGKYLCSKSCRYKRNTMIWSLKFMKEHKTLDWGVVRSWVEK